MINMHEDPDWISPDERDAMLAGVGHNSGDYDLDAIEALERVATETIKPRQWASIEALDQLRKAMRQGEAVDRDRAKEELTKAINGDLERFIAGELDGVLVGDDFNARDMKWRRDGLGYAALIGAIRYVRADATRQVDAALIALITWFCGKDNGTCDETRETFAAILNRSPDRIGDALERIAEAGIFESFRGEKNSRRFRARLVPAMARANHLNVAPAFRNAPKAVRVPLVGKRFSKASVATASSEQEKPVATGSSELPPKSVATASSELNASVATDPSELEASVATGPSHSYPTHQEEGYPSSEVVASGSGSTTAVESLLDKVVPAGSEARPEQDPKRRTLVTVPRPEASAASPTATPSSSSSRSLMLQQSVLLESDNDGPARIDPARQRVIVSYPTGKPLVVAWSAIEAAASASGWSSVTPERLLLEVQSIVEGWATPQEWRTKGDKTYRPSSVVTDLTTELLKSKGKLAKAMAAGKVAEAEARTLVAAIPNDSFEASAKAARQKDQEIFGHPNLPVVKIGNASVNGAMARAIHDKLMHVPAAMVRKALDEASTGDWKGFDNKRWNPIRTIAEVEDELSKLDKRLAEKAKAIARYEVDRARIVPTVDREQWRKLYGIADDTKLDAKIVERVVAWESLRRAYSTADKTGLPEFPFASALDLARHGEECKAALLTAAETALSSSLGTVRLRQSFQSTTHVLLCCGVIRSADDITAENVVMAGKMAKAMRIVVDTDAADFIAFAEYAIEKGLGGGRKFLDQVVVWREAA